MHFLPEFLILLSNILFLNAINYQASIKLNDSISTMSDLLSNKTSYFFFSSTTSSMKSNISNNWILIYFENYNVYLFGILLLFLLTPVLIFLWFFKFLVRKCLVWFCRKKIFKCKKKRRLKNIKHGSILSGECICSVRIRSNQEHKRDSESIRYYPLQSFISNNFETEIREYDSTNNRKSIKNLKSKFLQSSFTMDKFKQKESLSEVIKNQVYKSNLNRQKIYSISCVNCSISQLASEEDLSDYGDFKSLGDIRKEIKKLEKLNINF